MTDRFSPIDPATLPPLTLVVVPDKESIIAARMAQVVSVWQSYDPPFAAAYDVGGLEFDPIKITMEVGTSFELNALTLVNKMGQATTLAEAFGPNLDAIGSRYPDGVPRLQIGTDSYGNPIMEADSRYRLRLWLSSNAFSTAGSPGAYQFEALTFDPSLRDVTATVQRAGLNAEPIVIITCLEDLPLANLDGTFPPYVPQPTTDALLAILVYLQDPDISPLTDVISVIAPTIVNTTYDLVLTLFPNADEQESLTAVQNAIAALQLQNLYLGVDHTLMDIEAACDQIGVQNVKINSPAADVPADWTQVVIVTDTSVTVDPVRDQ